jgi:uncharacterized lipoprotein YmbA
MQGLIIAAVILSSCSSCSSVQVFQTATAAALVQLQLFIEAF